MAAITYGAAGSAAATTTVSKAAPTAKAFWARLWDAFIEARMRQAMREVALHRHLLPADLETSYNRNSTKINP
jgi:uncharacterized membrane protein